MNTHASPSIPMAAQVLREGKVIAYPTEAVWGLGCNPKDEAAVRRLLALKSRAVEKGLILISGNIAHFSGLLSGLDDKYQQKLAGTWPGPFTWLVAHRGLIPEWITGQFDTVAIRVTAHPYVQALTEAYGGAIVSTSANPQGLQPAKSAQQVADYFKGEEPFITGGDIGESNQPSEVRDLITDKLIRAGG